MKLADFTKLKKLMQLTQSGNDNEALGALRKANEILTSYQLDWNRVFSRLVKVETPVESAEDADKPERQRIEEAFAAVEDGDPRGSFADFIASLKEQWDQRGYLSEKQKDALFTAASNRRGT